MKRILGVLLFFVFTSADAALFNRGGGLIYDSVLDITWLQDANYAQTSGYDADGQMSWDDAVAWAADLIFVGSDGVTYDDWRLPSMDVNGDDAIGGCFGGAAELACRDNEYGYLFVQYNVTFSSPGLFTNLQIRPYWSGTEGILPDDPNDMWVFSFLSGMDGTEFRNSNRMAAWAVRSGNVSAVPVPAAVWLFGSGLIGLLGMARRKR